VLPKERGVDARGRGALRGVEKLLGIEVVSQEVEGIGLIFVGEATIG